MNINKQRTKCIIILIKGVFIDKLSYNDNNKTNYNHKYFLKYLILYEIRFNFVENIFHLNECV